MKPNYQLRIQRLRDLLPKDVNGVLVTNPRNVLYLSGFKGVALPDEREIELFISTKSVNMFLKPFYETEAKEATEGIDIYPTRGPFNYNPDFSLIKEILQKENLALSISVETSNLNLEEAQNLEQEGIIYSKIDIDKNLKSIKDAWEIEQLSKACHIGDMAFEYILTQVKSGMSEFDLKKLLEEYLLSQQEADGLSFGALVAYGQNAADPHRESGDTEIVNGNFLSFDFGVRVNSYCSDMTRVIFLGSNPSEEQMKIYKTAIRAQKLSIDYVNKPGDVDAARIDILANEYIQSFGYPEFLGHSHGIGTADHERPDLLPASKDKVSENMAFTIEPGVYLPGVCGVRIEDELVKTSTGADILTKSPKDLICIDLETGKKSIISYESLLLE